MERRASLIGGAVAAAGLVAEPEKTFAWYWLKNAGDGEYFAHRRRVRGVPQFRGAQPVGEFALQHHAATRYRHRRSGHAGVVQEDHSGIQFHKLDIASPEPLPIGPTTVIGDNVGFTRQA